MVGVAACGGGVLRIRRVMAIIASAEVIIGGTASRAAVAPEAGIVSVCLHGALSARCISVLTATTCMCKRIDEQFFRILLL